MPTPIRELPPGYQQTAHLVLTSPQVLGKLVIYSVIGLVIAIIGTLLWASILPSLRPPQLDPAPPFIHGSILTIFIAIATLILHEGIHGVAILWTGHKPRFGMMIEYGILYATADGAYFRRREFIIIALAPLVVLTFGGMLLMLLLPPAYAVALGFGIVVNGSGAVGDVWMTALVLRCPPGTLVRDEADSIRIFQRG